MRAQARHILCEPARRVEPQIPAQPPGAAAPRRTSLHLTSSSVRPTAGSLLHRRRRGAESLKARLRFLSIGRIRVLFQELLVILDRLLLLVLFLSGNPRRDSRLRGFLARHCSAEDEKSEK